MKTPFAVMAAALCAATFAAPSAIAGQLTYLGAWRIAGAVVAPWADPAHPPDGAERSRLVGKTLVFKARAIEGPQPLACRGPHYQLRDFTADGLFQGQFDEMRMADKRVDPDRLAAGLGFKGRHIQTLDTGCEIDFHFVDAATAEFGLNDYVYTLKRP